MSNLPCSLYMGPKGHSPRSLSSPDIQAHPSSLKPYWGFKLEPQPRGSWVLSSPSDFQRLLTLLLRRSPVGCWLCAFCQPRCGTQTLLPLIPPEVRLIQGSEAGRSFLRGEGEGRARKPTFLPSTECQIPLVFKRHSFPLHARHLVVLMALRPSLSVSLLHAALPAARLSSGALSGNPECSQAVSWSHTNLHFMSRESPAKYPPRQSSLPQRNSAASSYNSKCDFLPTPQRWRRN